MGKIQIIVTRVTINTEDQVKYFQMRLPQNTKSIVGVEALCPVKPLPKVSLFPEFSFGRSIVLGELKLQVCGKANIFYAKQVMCDENIHFGDFSQSIKFYAQPFSHQMRMEEDIVEVDSESTHVLGMYQDRGGDQVVVNNGQYTVTVCLWVELQEEEKGKPV